MCFCNFLVLQGCWELLGVVVPFRSFSGVGILRVFLRDRMLGFAGASLLRAAPGRASPGDSAARRWFRGRLKCGTHGRFGRNVRSSLFGHLEKHQVAHEKQGTRNLICVCPHSTANLSVATSMDLSQRRRTPKVFSNKTVYSKGILQLAGQVSVQTY